MLITEEIEGNNNNNNKKILEGLTFYWERNGMRVIQIHFWHKFLKREGNLPGKDVYVLMYNQSMHAIRIFWFQFHLL